MRNSNRMRWRLTVLLVCFIFLVLLAALILSGLLVVILHLAGALDFRNGVRPDNVSGGAPLRVIFAMMAFSTFLGTALAVVSQEGGLLEGVGMLLVYCAGLGLPFVICAVLIDMLKGTLTFIRQHMKAINIVSGALLVAVGILMATGLMERLLGLLSI